jgi:hypothetical protein
LEGSTNLKGATRCWYRFGNAILLPATEIVVNNKKKKTTINIIKKKTQN